MITFSFLKAKRYRLLLLIMLFAIIMILATFIDGAYENYSPKATHQLQIKQEFTIPLQEISGMAVKAPDSEGGREILLVGDQAARINVGRLQGQVFSEQTVLDFAPAILSRFGLCQSQKIPGCRKYIHSITSQWEAIARDQTGLLYILHEQLATIFVYHPEENRLISWINLASFQLETNEKSSESKAMPFGENQENAFGEGFVLLKNGHILVIKERFRPSVIEFGPENAVAAGYTPELNVNVTNDPFPFGNQTTNLVPLKIWHLPTEYRLCDISEIASDSVGQLFLLSQQCQWIAQLAPLALEANHLTIQKLWGLPNKLKHAEALGVLDEKTFLVGEDRQSVTKSNLFLLTAP